MKNKIRRAFDLTKPNVMNRVLEDCPVPENIAAKPKRKRLSDRTVRFISVAASFAILISAVGGGFVYFRDYFGGQGALSGSPEEPNNTAPDLNLDWQTPIEGVMISEEYAKEIALEHAQGSMGACKVVSCELVDNEYYKVGISGEMLCWYSDVYVDAYSGEVIDPTIPADLIPEEKAKKIALAKAEETYDSCIVYACELVGDTYYRIYISCVYPNEAYPGDRISTFWGVVYFVNADTGEFRDPDHIGSGGSAMEEDEARKIASAQANALYDSFLITNCKYYFFSGLHSFYDFTLLAETDHGTEEVHLVVIDWLAYQAVDDPVDPPVGQTLTMSGARDIALGMWGHSVDDIHCLKIAENSDFYTVYYEQGEYAYEFHIDFDGNVLYDAGAQQIGLRADWQMGHLIGWEKARNIALGACGRNVPELIGFTYDYHPGDPDYYHLELYFPDDAFSYRIGALNGELLEGNVSPMHLDFHVSDGPVYTPIDDLIHNYDHNIRLVVITSADELAQLHEDSGYEVPTQYDEDFFKESALLIVDYYYGSSQYQIRITDILMDAEGNYTVSVAYCARELGDCMVVTGSLLAEVYQPIDPTAQVDLNITQLEEDKWNDLISSDTIIDIEKATQIAMEYTGHMEDYAAGNVTDLACKFDEENNTYYVYFRANYKSYAIGIHAYSGEVLICDYWVYGDPPQDGMISVEMAFCLAVDYTGHGAYYTQGDLDDMACTLDESGASPVYYVYYRMLDKEYTVAVDAYTGEILSCNGQGTDAPAFYTEEDAIQAALGYSNLNADNYPVIECHQVGTETNRTIYLVICKGGVTITTMVDANTLRIMDHGMGSFPEAALSRVEARTIASKVCGLEDEGPLGHPSIGMFNDGVLFYCNTIYWDEMVYVVVMDANTGEVLAQSKFENTRIPGLILSEEHALEYALANAFVSLADAEDPTVIHDPDTQTYTVTFRYQGDLCTAIIDDYNGALIDMYWIVDE